MFNFTNFILDTVKPVFKDIYSKLNNAILKLEFLSKGGDFVGFAATVSNFPTKDLDDNALERGDWVILTQDDGNDVRGIYVYNGSAWSLVIPVSSLTLEEAYDAFFGKNITDTEAKDLYNGL